MKSYSPAGVVMEFGGIVTGYADGVFIKAGRAEDMWKLIVGADGDTCRVRSQNASGLVTVTLMQSSPTNDIFSAIQVLDELTGEGVLPLLIKDLNGTAVVVAGEAWITKPSDMSYGKDLGDREWIIQCAKMQIAGGAIL